MVFIIQEMHTIEYMEKVVSISLNIVTGVGIIIGLGYLKTLKDKTYIATFSFWTQFYNRVYELLKWLEDDNNIINNLYSPEAKKTWENCLAETSDKTNEFKDKVKEILIFLKQTPDQMPAYIGWTSDYNYLMVFFYDIIKYDICNPDDCFKFCVPTEINLKNDYCKKIIKVMTNMCNGIKKRQEIVEKRIYKSKW